MIERFVGLQAWTSCRAQTRQHILFLDVILNQVQKDDLGIKPEFEKVKIIQFL